MHQKKKLFDTRFSLLILSQLILIGMVVSVWLTLQNSSPVLESSHRLREIAAKLHASGVSLEAAKFYEKYLQNQKIDSGIKSQIAYSLGEIYEEKNQLETALGWYYQVEIFDKKSNYLVEANKKIVSVLEKMKKFSAAKRTLNRQTNLNTSNLPSEGAIAVAQVGNKTIYRHQVLAALDQLPPQLRQSFAQQGMENFLQKYVADELLYEKAIRLNHAQDSKIKKQILSLTKQILIQKVISDEVQSKVKADQTDIKNFYQANQDRYTEKEHAEVAMIKTKSKQKLSDIVNQLKAGKSFASLAKQYSEDQTSKNQGGQLLNKVVAGLPFQGLDTKKVAQILDTATGKWTQPILSDGAYRIFSVLNKTPEKRPEYSAIKNRVTQDYKQDKMQSLYQQLITETLAQDRVKLFPERFKK